MEGVDVMLELLTSMHVSTSHRLYKGDLEPHIPPCVMALSAMGLGFLPTTHEKTQNKCVHNFCAPCSILGMYIFMLRLQ